MSVGRWFLGGTEPDATARLFAFPHAGGAGGVYRSWQGRMSPGYTYARSSIPATWAASASP